MQPAGLIEKAAETDVAVLPQVADVEAWVQRHGHRRLTKHLLAGHFKGDTLRAVRTWMALRAEQRKRGAVLIIIAFATAVAIGTIAHLAGG